MADPADPPLVVSNLKKIFGEETDNASEVIANISLSLGHGEIVSVVGPSGCGKSTLLNLLCGLMPRTAGEIFWYGGASTGMPKRVGYMLQKDLLLPWRTALKNVTLGLEIHNVPSGERIKRARQLLDTIGLNGFHDYYPSALSGGMRQRVALARTLANEPEVLLLDEPFAALDFQTKLVLENDMARLVRSQRRSLLLITHDVEEAVSLSDRVIVLTHRPARIRAIHEINIDVDRTDMMAARESPHFTEYIRSIWSELEVQRPNMNIERRDIASAAVDVPSDATLTAPTPHRPGRRFRALRGNVLVLACQIAVLVVLLASWQFATANSALSAFLFGSPSAIWGFLVQMWKDGSLSHRHENHRAGNSAGLRRRQCPRHTGRACAMVFAFRVAGRPALRRRPRINPDHRACTDLHYLVRHRSRLESRDGDVVGGRRSADHRLQGGDDRRCRSDQSDAHARSFEAAISSESLSYPRPSVTFSPV